jgi:TIR domain
MPVKVFFCYAHEDEPLLKRLKIHLTLMQRQGLIDIWHDRDISAGTEWEREICEQLNSAQIILLLVSPDFMASEYCYGTEMKQAIERHNRKEARVIPVILRPIDWQDILGNIQALPTDAKPVLSSFWHSPDDAFFDVAQGIRKVVGEISKQPIPLPIKRAKEIQSDRTTQREINDQDRSSDPQAIKNQFHEAMVNLYKEAAKIGYRATQFIHMVNDNGGVETAHLLLAKDPTDGFTNLWERKRLDLSVEALVLKPQFVPLFDEVERENARKRLAEYGYKAPWDNHK